MEAEEVAAAAAVAEEAELAGKEAELAGKAPTAATINDAA